MAMPANSSQNDVLEAAASVHTEGEKAHGWDLPWAGHHATEPTFTQLEHLCFQPEAMGQHHFQGSAPFPWGFHSAAHTVISAVNLALATFSSKSEGLTCE